MLNYYTKNNVITLSGIFLVSMLFIPAFVPVTDAQENYVIPNWIKNNADLSGADLRKAFLSDVNLSNANLDGALLDGATLNCKNHSVCVQP